MIATPFTELVGCTVPIQLAGISTAATPELVAAISNAGGLGMLGTARPGLTADTLHRLLDQTHALTNRPFAVNFIVKDGHDTDRRCFVAAAKAARVVDLFYGEPDPALVDLVHEHGALACWQVGSLAEAVAAQAAGCDFIVAQGIEAGGHVRGRTGVLALLGEVLDAVDIPVLAAGGIGNGRALAAVLAAGAAGARIGTRFLAATEADAHAAYVAALIAARAGDTVLTEAFSEGWPNAPHRVLKSCVAAGEAFAGDIVGDLASLDGSRVPFERLSCWVVDRTATGDIAAMSLWAGESVSALKCVQPAAEIVAEIAGDAERLLRAVPTLAG
jgi:NAD(P)H-dependent flavin oxidoreductase YrpB (nitropropane dioxygenase family)